MNESIRSLFATGLASGASYVAAYSALVVAFGGARLTVHPSLAGSTLRILGTEGLLHLGLGILEEALFRGILLQKTKRRLSVPFSIFLGSPIVFRNHSQKVVPQPGSTAQLPVAPNHHVSHVFGQRLLHTWCGQALVLGLGNEHPIFTRKVSP